VSEYGSGSDLAFSTRPDGGSELALSDARPDGGSDLALSDAQPDGEILQYADSKIYDDAKNNNAWRKKRNDKLSTYYGPKPEDYSLTFDESAEDRLTESYNFNAAADLNVHYAKVSGLVKARSSTK